jgi:hypothetical protein
VRSASKHIKKCYAGLKEPGNDGPSLCHCRSDILCLVTAFWHRTISDLNAFPDQRLPEGRPVMAAEEEVPEKENLELDKLDVSLPTGTEAQPSESSDPDRTSGDHTALPKTPSVLRRILGLARHKGFALSLAVGLVVGSIAVFVVSHYISSSQDRDLAEAPQGKITYSVSCPVGFKYHVAFKLLVPFNGNDEKRAQAEVLPRIRSELMTLGQTADVAKWLREKDIEALKAEILKTVNKVTGIPLTELELVGLAVNE